MLTTPQRWFSSLELCHAATACVAVVVLLVFCWHLWRATRHGFYARELLTRQLCGGCLESCFPTLPRAEKVVVLSYAAHAHGTLPPEPLGSTSCAVCIEPLLDGESVLRLRCGHTYHEACIMPWLANMSVSPSCPICKANPLDVPPACCMCLPACSCPKRSAWSAWLAGKLLCRPSRMSLY
jgi:hypothetical protein